MRYAAFLCLAAALAAPARAENDRDIISVNGTVIRQSEIMERLWRRYGSATLDEMVDELLLRQAAQAQDIKADQAEVDKRLARVQEQFSDPAILENQLKQSGSSLVKLRSEIADQVLMRQLIVSAKKIAVKDGELRKAFANQRDKLASPEAVHLRHILVKTQAEAEDIASQVRNGADFQALARQRSLAPTGKINGGDYGFVSRGMLPEEIDRIAFSMKAGELRIVSSAKGFHVLQVLAHRPAQPAVYEKVKDDLKDLVLEEKMKAVLADYLKELRGKADIKPLGAIF